MWCELLSATPQCGFAKTNLVAEKVLGQDTNAILPKIKPQPVIGVVKNGKNKINISPTWVSFYEKG